MEEIYSRAISEGAIEFIFCIETIQTILLYIIRSIWYYSEMTEGMERWVL